MHGPKGFALGEAHADGYCDKRAHEYQS
jgi:hypothetical protein